MNYRPTNPPTTNEIQPALAQLAQMLEERDIQAIVKALKIPLENGYGLVEIELLEGHVRVARGTATIKP